MIEALAWLWKLRLQWPGDHSCHVMCLTCGVVGRELTSWSSTLCSTLVPHDLHITIRLGSSPVRPCFSSLQPASQGPHLQLSAGALLSAGSSMTCAPSSSARTSRLVLVQPPGPTAAQQAEAGLQLSVWQQQAPGDHLLQLLAAARWEAAFAFTQAQGLSSDFVYRHAPRACPGRGPVLALHGDGHTIACAWLG